MTDEAVMEMVKQGDLEKVSILFERYQKMLYNFFLKLSFETELSKDLTQNVFYRLIKYRNSYRQGHSFKSWFFQMARNLYKDHMSNAKNKKNRFGDIEKISDLASEKLQDVEQAEREKALYKALSLLDQEQREIIILSKFQKMKYIDIAGVMDITESAVKVKVHRAIKKLKGLYFMTEQG
ncbi:MAG: sigma-70 family RNA polymerase sigma factor [Bacteroidota bacterium]